MSFTQATVVSAYFPIPSKFSPQHYLTWIKNFFENIPCYLVFFTDEQLIPLFEEWRGKFMDRTVFVPFNFTRDATAFKRYGSDFWKKQLDLDEECDFHDKTRKIHTPELYAIWYEKKEFVLKAIEMNPFGHDKYLWADAGGFRIQEWYPKLQTFALADQVPDNKMFLLEIEPFTKDPRELSLKTTTVGGGYLAAHKNVWASFSEKYDQMLEEYVAQGHFVGKDQHIFASMYLKTPDQFDLVKTDKTSLDPWFWPQLYFSGVIEFKPQITVLIPLYNGLEFLYQSLGSIFKQTYTNYNVLIAINGHPENSEVFIETNRIVSLFEANFNKQGVTTILQLDTKGKPASMNKAVEFIKSPFVAILDVDDIWLPTKLTEQIGFLKDFDVVGTIAQYFGDSTNIPSIPSRDISKYDFFSVNPLINSSVVLKTELLKYDPSETTGLEDYELWLRLRYKMKSKFYNIPKVLVGHRIHTQSAFNNTNSNYLEEFLQRKRKEFIES